MEAELLAGVIQTDTHKRLQIADKLIEYFKKEDAFDDFQDIERLMGGLSSWVASSNFKVVYDIILEVMFYAVSSFSDLCKWYADYGGNNNSFKGQLSSLHTNKLVTVGQMLFWCALIGILLSSSFTEGEARGC